MCVSVFGHEHVSAGPQRYQKKAPDTLKLECRRLWAPWPKWLELNSDHLQEQQVLLTTGHLSSLIVL